jgi:RNA polymerase sigma-70 factor (ECF subfamily)
MGNDRMMGTPSFLLSDERLARRTPRDPDRFATLYERHRARVYAQCLRRLRSPADADDATQATFLSAFAAIRRGTVPRRVGPWLGGIARNVCNDRLGARRELPGLDDLDEPVDDGPDLDAALLAEADGLIVRSALARLPFAQRSVLHLREVGDLSYAEVAEKLGLQVSAAETLLFRARANLRDEVIAARSPLDCEAARHMAALVRAGDEVRLADRKALRNHREACSDCSSLPVRRSRRPHAAAVLLAGLIFGAARRALAVPAAQAAQVLGTATESTKVAAVALSIGGVAAGGAAVVPSALHDAEPRVAQAAASAERAAERKATSAPAPTRPTDRTPRAVASAPAASAETRRRRRAAERPAARAPERERGDREPQRDERPPRDGERDDRSPPADDGFRDLPDSDFRDGEGHSGPGGGGMLPRDDSSGPDLFEPLLGPRQQP